ncbi:MAG: oxidoreductase, partial [Clostridia bacterium]|nr:oxidoreductase [Clostridia bacterium]
DKLLVGTAVPEKLDVNEKFRILALRLREHGYITGKPLKRTGAMIMRPSNIRQLSITKDNIALLGEAAGFISPSSAEGISYALESGRILAEAMTNNLSAFALRYKKGLWRIKFNLIYKKAKVLLMYNKFSRRMIMKSGILSMKVEIQ